MWRADTAGSQHIVANGLAFTADGIVRDRDGTVWVAVDERNAIVRVRRDGRVAEYFRNPADAASKLRNGGPLEFPAGPVLLPDGRLCGTQSDGNRRDNAPNSAGEASRRDPFGRRCPACGLEHRSGVSRASCRGS